MLLKITTSCSMGCTHCMDSCVPSDDHMDFETLKSAVSFIRSNNPSVIIVSGGEPTDHPNFLGMMKYIIEMNTGRQIVVATNGLWLVDSENKEYANSILELSQYSKQLGGNEVKFQVTTDDRFYPTKVKVNSRLLKKHQNITVVDRITCLTTVGRAKDNELPPLHFKQKAPKCFNIRSYLNHAVGSNLGDAIRFMESNGKFCSPSINISGSVSAGETIYCERIGNVKCDQDLTEYAERLKGITCDACDAHKLLPKHALKAIGR